MFKFFSCKAIYVRACDSLHLKYVFALEDVAANICVLSRKCYYKLVGSADRWRQSGVITKNHINSANCITFEKYIRQPYKNIFR